MLAGAHKKFYHIQHPEIYLLDLKVQYKHKIKLPLNTVSKHVFFYLCLPDNYIFSNSLVSYRITFEDFQNLGTLTSGGRLLPKS